MKLTETQKMQAAEAYVAQLEGYVKAIRLKLEKRDMAGLYMDGHTVRNTAEALTTMLDLPTDHTTKPQEDAP